MTTIEKKKEYSITKLLSSLKYLLILFSVFVVGFTLLKFPENSARGVLNGIDISFNTLIPSLFPFLIFSRLIINTDILNKISKPANKLSSLLFSQPGQSLVVFILSMIGGYPIGAGMVKDLYEKGEISLDEGQRMLLYCMGPGPAFVITTIGYGMLHSQNMGIIIYVSVVLSSLILGILSRFLKNSASEHCSYEYYSNTDMSFSHTFVKSVTQSTNGMISICAWVTLFSCVIELYDVIIINQHTKALLCSISEVTTACKILSNEVSLPVIAGIIAFGGISTHLQVMPSVLKLKLKLKYFEAARVIHAVLSLIISKIILDIFPQSTDVISVGNKPQSADVGASFSVTVALFVMCCLIMIGDNVVIKLKK